MKVFLLVLFACLGAASAQFNRFSQFDSAVNRGLKIRGVDVSAPPAKGIQELYFEQVLDHFNGQNNATWKQRYFVNDQFWDGKGPVLLMIGGEGPISSAYVQEHFITYNYAQQYNALLVALEHRFYGESQPLDASKTENLAYLSSEQALADLAWFREQYGASVGAADKKWIAFGGSYPGCLSGWLRQKYPSSFYGSFAASAPVDAKLDFFEYFEVVERSIGEKCAADFQGASEKLWEMAQTADGRSQIKDLFNLCADLPSDALSLANFMMGLTDPIAEGVQYNEDRGNPSAITPICDAMANATDKIQGWASIVAQTQQGQCMDASYESAVQSLVTPGAARSWTYQTCNEYVKWYFFFGMQNSRGCKQIGGCGDFLILPLFPNSSFPSDFRFSKQRTRPSSRLASLSLSSITTPFATTLSGQTLC
uniref:Uncharacterized protein n=2 Tax=Palpitomonas bilix TaxID=652834 RepID=A0A7S3GBX6_9EUKA